jgi:hypothetical protein
MAAQVPEIIDTTSYDLHFQKKKSIQKFCYVTFILVLMLIWCPVSSQNVEIK